MDTKPRQLDHSRRQILTQLARLAADMVDRYRRASEADLPVAASQTNWP